MTLMTDGPLSIPVRERRQCMNRRLIWSAAVAVMAVAVAAPLLAQNRQGGQSSEEKAALAEHKAQEQRERNADAERAKRREAARAGQDSRDKTRPQKEEEEEKPRGTP
jgi:hypothetical protein